MVEFNKIEQQIVALKKHGHFFEEYLEFYKQILTLQHNKKLTLNKDKLSIFSKTEVLDNQLTAGLPLIDPKNLYIEDAFSESFFQELIKLFEQYPTQYSTIEISNMQNAFQKNEFRMNELLRNFIAKNANYFIELANNIKVEKSLLIFMAQTMSLPLLESYRKILLLKLKTANSVWLKSFCPLCGNNPSMARLDQEVGRRFLWCSICNAQWTFARIRCPFCLNGNQDKLRYFYIKENEPYRVDVCDKCKRFIKTFDERKVEKECDVDMATHDMVTQYLDEIAEKEGFQSTVWWLEYNKI